MGERSRGSSARERLPGTGEQNRPQAEPGTGQATGSRHTVLVHPDYAAGLQPLPNWENSGGCCGPRGDEGLNRACPCGAPVATLAADCFGPFALRLDPVRTYAFSQ